MKKTIIDWIALVLVIIGGLSWALVGIFSFDLVEFLLGAVPILQRIIYILVGLAAAYLIYFLFKNE